MSKDNKVSSLAEARDRKNHEKGHALHADGKLFKFEIFEYSDVEPFGVGTTTGDHPICVIMNPNLSGICMTRDSARRLGAALLECAEDDIIHEDYEPEAEPPKAS